MRLKRHIIKVGRVLIPRRLIIALLPLLLQAGYMHAQNFKASASQNTVGVGQQFQVNYSIDAQAGGFRAPSFSGFDVYSGPNESSSIQFINGSVSQTLSISFILAAKQEGTFTIDGASIESGGKTFTSNSLVIKAVKGSAPSQPAQAQQQGGGSGQQTTALAGDAKKNLFIRIIPDKTKVYQGQQLLLTVKIFSRMNLQNLDNANFPDYNGFYSQDITPKNQQIIPSKEVYNGVTYMTAVLKQAIVFPQHTGVLKIDPASVDCTVAEKVKANNIFDAFFGGSYRNVKYSIKSDPIAITVLPLPETKKPFSGAVGQYSIKGTLDRTNVKANDAVNLTISVTGSGNLKLIDTLPVKFPPDFDHYDPKIADHFSATASGISGSRTFNYLLIPRSEGHYKIPSEEFTYFDPEKKGYVSLAIPEFAIDVAKGDNTGAVSLNNGTNKEDVKMLGQDIRYLHTGRVPAVPADTKFLYSLPFYAGMGLPVLAFLILAFARRKYIAMNSDQVAVRKRGATRMAKKRLKAAYGFMNSGNKAAFYAEIHSALMKYLSDKFTIPLSELSREKITEELKKKNIKDENIASLMAALDNCEFARYAPSNAAGNLNQVYESAMKLITELHEPPRA